MNKLKKIIITTIIMLGIILICFCLYRVHKSRNFQFFGNLQSTLSNSGNNEKRIALTFDDGPTEDTQYIINVLDELDVVGTFFLCGEQIAERPEEVKALVDAGHAIGNHSYSHDRMVLKSSSFYQEEVDKTNALIRESGYQEEIFFRPPYGKKLIGLPYYLRKIGMKTAMWSVEPETELGFKALGEELAQLMLEQVEDGSIILLHPMYNPENVMEALKIAVPKLKADGYTFITMR